MPNSPKNGFSYVEVPRHDEEHEGVPAPVTPQASAGRERRSDGTIALGATDIPSKGGKATRGTTLLSHRIASTKLMPRSVRRAQTLRAALSGEIASVLGGGTCGIAASLFVKFASQKTAAAEEAFQAGDYETHRKLSESARMDVLYAREHAIKEAAARRDAGDAEDTLSKRRAAFQQTLVEGAAK